MVGCTCCSEAHAMASITVRVVSLGELSLRINAVIYRGAGFCGNACFEQGRHRTASLHRLVDCLEVDLSPLSNPRVFSKDGPRSDLTRI